MPTPFHKRTLTLVLLLLLVVCAGWLCVRTNSGADDKQVTTTEEPSISKENAVAALDGFCLHIEERSTTSDTLASISSLKAYLQSLPADLAAEVVNDYLASGNDASTNLPFKVQKGGDLSSHPSLRVALLDFISKINGKAAAKISRELLQTPSNPDEWSVALRNVARIENDTASRDYLRKKTEALINNPEWQANPTTGYYEAFDLLVHTKSTESTPLLSSLIRKKDRKDLRHAAFLTLDRLAQVSTAELLTKLSEDESLEQAYPEMVAQQFARADLNNDKEKKLVQDWLSNPKRTQKQLEIFRQIHPNKNSFVSNTLISQSLQPKD